jgi:casein kinase I homolog HRR25
MNILEASILEKLGQKNYKNFPKLLAIGERSNQGYLIMDRLG